MLAVGAVACLAGGFWLQTRSLVVVNVSGALAILVMLGGVLGAAPADLIFFDDRRTNIDGALAFGIDARLWTSAAAARVELRAEFGDLGA